MTRPVRTALLSGLLALAVAAGAARAHAQPAIVTGQGMFTARVVSLRDMPFRTVVRQQFDFSCGSAALATLLREHLGVPLGEAEVFRAMYAQGDQEKIRRQGFSLLDMKTYLTSLGLPANGYRTTAARLADTTRPAVALVTLGGYRHFVVVKGVRAGRVLVGDPALGLKTFSVQEFDQIWDGVVLRVDRDSAAYNRADEWAALTSGPLTRLDERPAGGLVRELPPLYQISPMRPGLP
jgi:hypothetical protein